MSTSRCSQAGRDSRRRRGRAGPTWQPDPWRSRGTLDDDGCLVCPWHGSRYDVDSGAMVSGSRGLLWYVGRTPGYTQLVLAYGAVLTLRRRAVAMVGDRFVVKG